MRTAARAKDTPKAMTVRLPADLYRATRDMARKHKMSVNRLLQESLRARLQVEEDQVLYDAFTRAGAVAEDSSVDYAFEAQREVVLRDE